MMKIVVAAAALMMGTSLALAQTGTAPDPGAAGAARPARGPEQTSTPNAAPPATTGQTTAARTQSPVVQEMNEAERRKVEEKGK